MKCVICKNEIDLQMAVQRVTYSEKCQIENNKLRHRQYLAKRSSPCFDCGKMSIGKRCRKCYYEREKN